MSGGRGATERGEKTANVKWSQFESESDLFLTTYVTCFMYVGQHGDFHKLVLTPMYF